MNQTDKVGIILPHLGSSQLSYLACQYIHSLTEERPDMDFVLFYEDLVKPCMIPSCAMLNISEVWHFDGTLISTDIPSTLSSIKANSPTKKIFYVWDLEWLRAYKQAYTYNIKAFMDYDVKIVCRSNSHALETSYFSNRKVDAVIENFDLRAILEL